MGTFSLQCHCGLEVEYLKLVELVIIMVLGNVEDEKTFSIINFMKSKLCNCLIVHFGFGGQRICMPRNFTSS